MPDRTILADWEKHLLTGRTPDGGFNTTPGAATGSVSGTFLAYLALDGLGKRFPLSLRMVYEARSLRSPIGSLPPPRILPLPDRDGTYQKGTWVPRSGRSQQPRSHRRRPASAGTRQADRAAFGVF
jgi:hypothetical protein